MNDSLKDINYKKNFLKEVIARVDLLSPLPDLDTALPPSISELAVKGFPIPEPRDTVKKEVEFGPTGLVSREERSKEWRFHGKERTKTLTIGKDVVWVQHTKYQNYEIVKDEFTTILDRIAQQYGRVQCSRVGLRYVNTIDLAEANPTDWTSYLDSHLLSAFQFTPQTDRAALSRVFHNVELAFETFNLRYRFGMHNPDYPARIRQKVFVLDLDAYVQSAVDISEVSALLDNFHATIQRYFELSITEQLRGVMNAG